MFWSVMPLPTLTPLWTLTLIRNPQHWLLLLTSRAFASVQLQLLQQVWSVLSLTALLVASISFAIHIAVYQCFYKPRLRSTSTAVGGDSYHMIRGKVLLEVRMVLCMILLMRVWEQHWRWKRTKHTVLIRGWEDWRWSKMKHMESLDQPETFVPKLSFSIIVCIWCMDQSKLLLYGVRVESVMTRGLNGQMSYLQWEDLGLLNIYTIQGRNQDFHEGGAVRWSSNSPRWNHAWPAFLAIGGGCGRGMCPFPQKAEAFGIFLVQFLLMFMCF